MNTVDIDRFLLLSGEYLGGELLGYMIDVCLTL